MLYTDPYLLPSPEQTDPVDVSLHINLLAEAVDLELGKKADLTSPEFTGTPTSTTPSPGNNTTYIATTAFVKTAIDNDVIATGEVVNSMLASDSVTNIKVSASAAIAQSKISGLTTDLGLKAPLASPTFTGTVVLPSTTSIGTVTSTHIGYLFAAASNIQDQINAKAERVREPSTDLIITSNITTLDVSKWSIGVVAPSPPAANFTLNLTNVLVTDNTTITITLMVTQGSTGYIPSALQIDGVGQTIKWQGGVAPVPTSGAGKIDIFSFTIARRTTWSAYGSALLNF